MSLDLSEFEAQIQMRPLTHEDFDALVGLQRSCFPPMKP